jgi:Fe-S cluster biogenesis protein NfuA/nitrite reductase/ring-hydroxylating ferredoxin subunit
MRRAAENVEDRQLIGRVEGLLEELESLPDPAARELALETVQALLELYGAGLERLTAHLGESEASVLTSDELVEHLLLLHGLHPVGVEERVRKALHGVRPYLGSHGGDVELAGVADGVATVRMRGSCEGCPASAMTLKLAIEDAVLKAVPDVERVEALQDASDPAPTGSPVLQIEVLGPAVPEAAWITAGALPMLSAGGTLLREVAGERILFLRLQDGSPYAYRPDCPGCEGSLEGGSLEGAGQTGAELMCPTCRHRYDVVRAGRCLDAPELHLEPVPLLVDEAGLIRVAVQTGVL